MRWFRRNRSSSRAASEPPLGSYSRDQSTNDFAELLQSAAAAEAAANERGGPTPSGEEQSSLKPIQFLASRHTLFISPSEEELYLSALSGLEPSSPALPLWSEPPPELPGVQLDQAPLPVPHVPYPKTPSPPPLRPHRGHGILSLIGDGVVKLAGFPAVVVHEVHQALSTWRYGVTRSKYIDRDIAIVDGDQGVEWKAELGGKVWRLKGSQELESIRLLIAIFTALGKHGYMMRGPIQPAMAKPDSHSFLFTYSHDIESFAPLFFAVTIPLPDRISVVSPPPSVDNHIIGAVRNAITGVDGTRSMTLPSPSKTIKMEGWVTSGVFRFWVGGLRRWPGGGVKREVVAQVQPEMVLAIVNGLAVQQFGFVGSVPFLPSTAGRDVLIFASSRETGLCWRDAFVDVTGLPPSDLAASTVVPVNGMTNGYSTPNVTRTAGLSLDLSRNTGMSSGKTTPNGTRAAGLSLDMPRDTGAWITNRPDTTRHIDPPRRRSFPRGASQTTADTGMSQLFYRRPSDTSYNEESFSRPRARSSFDRQSGQRSAAPSLHAPDTQPTCSPPRALFVDLPKTIPVLYPDLGKESVPVESGRTAAAELPRPAPAFREWAIRRPRSNEIAKPTPNYHKRSQSALHASDMAPSPVLAKASSPPSPSDRDPSPPFRKTRSSSPSFLSWANRRASTPAASKPPSTVGGTHPVSTPRTSYQLFEPAHNNSGTFGLYPGAAPLSRTPSPAPAPPAGRASAVAPDQPELSMAGSYPTLPGISSLPSGAPTQALLQPFIPSGAASESEYSESTTQAPDLERIDSDTNLLDLSPPAPIRSPTASEISSQAVFVTPPSTPPPGTTGAGGFAPHKEYRENLPSPSAAAKRSPPKTTTKRTSEPPTVQRAVAAQAAPATLLRPAAGARATIVPGPKTAHAGVPVLTSHPVDGEVRIPRRSSRRGHSTPKSRPAADAAAAEHHRHSENVKRIVSDRAAMLSRASMASNDSGASASSSRRVGSSRTRLSLTPKPARS